MPVTPFHLIAASPIKAIAPNKFSWAIFCLTNILIDLEPITCYLITLEPRHMFFHTIIGATLVAIVAATYGRNLCKVAIDIWNEEIRGKPEEKWLASDSYINKTAAWVGAILGAWSHLLLDSFMHFDIKPLSPFSNENVLLGTLSIPFLHSLCLGMGILGILIFLMKRKKLY